MPQIQLYDVVSYYDRFYEVVKIQKSELESNIIEYGLRRLDKVAISEWVPDYFSRVLRVQHLSAVPRGIRAAKCRGCSGIGPLDEFRAISDYYWCVNCVNIYFIHCDRCNSFVHRNNAFNVEGQEVCSVCFDTAKYCLDCNKYYWPENITNLSGRDVCNSCASNYERCESCGNMVPFQNMAGDDAEEDHICQDCYHKDVKDVIKRYNYKPEETFFHGEGDKFFGVELEVDDGGEAKRNAKRLLDLANGIGNFNGPFLYIKHDGSIVSGFEIVSHPMTLDFHLNEFHWSKILSELQSMGYTGHNNGTCGLHIHVSRAIFGVDRTSRTNIGKTIYLIEKFWPEILRFARRNGPNVERYANRYGLQSTPEEMFDEARFNGDRYRCINIMNSNTVEFRIFRSTLNKRTFFATLQFVDLLTDFAINNSFETISSITWQEFVDRISGKYKELDEYLRIRGLKK